MKKKTAIFVAIFAATALWAGTALAIDGTNPLPRTGQGEAGKCYNTADGVAVEVPCAGTGQDGEKRKGVAWPGTRYTDNMNGTVTDNLTGLIWLKTATCFGARNWNDATSLVAGLATGACGLSDGSTAGQWRLPNIKELESLVDLNYSNPPLTPGHPFILPGGDYTLAAVWSSTPDPTSTSWHYKVSFCDTGAVYNRNDNNPGGSDNYTITGFSNGYNWYDPGATGIYAGGFVWPVKTTP